MADFIDTSLILERVKEIIQERSWSNKDFCDHAEIPPSSFSQMQKNGSIPSVEAVNKLLKAAIEVGYDPYWLLFGEKRADIAGEVEPTEDLFSQKVTVMDGGVKQVDLLKAEIAHLRAELERKEEEVKALRERKISNIMVYYSDDSYSNYIAEKNK